MTLAELLRPESILVPLKADDREGAIAGLIQAMNLAAPPEEREAFRQAVLAREKAGSTGIGKGIAIPHARTRRASKPLLAAGRTAKPIDFASADAQPVTLVFLLAVPDADPKAHLQTLAALSRMASDAKLVKALNRAASAAELHKLVSSVAL